MFFFLYVFFLFFSSDPKAAKESKLLLKLYHDMFHNVPNILVINTCRIYTDLLLAFNSHFSFVK